MEGTHLVHVVREVVELDLLRLTQSDDEFDFVTCRPLRVTRMSVDTPDVLANLGLDVVQQVHSECRLPQYETYPCLNVSQRASPRTRGRRTL